MSQQWEICTNSRRVGPVPTTALVKADFRRALSQPHSRPEHRRRQHRFRGARNDRVGSAFPVTFAFGGSWWNLSMRAPFSGLTVLVVEDDWFVREDIANRFRQEGWMVLEAATGAKALELLREAKSIDLVITDIGLADAMTGWDVAEAVRIMYPEVPVIYASGAPDNDGRRVSESVFMSKPLTAHDLMLACSRLLSTGH
jgi:CheY-like chemotaxis protein